MRRLIPLLYLCIKGKFYRFYTSKSINMCGRDRLHMLKSCIESVVATEGIKSDKLLLFMLTQANQCTIQTWEWHKCSYLS